MSGLERVGLVLFEAWLWNALIDGIAGMGGVS